MSTIVTRAGKGSVLSHTEMDANLNNLNTDKLESSDIGVSIQAYSANLTEYASVNPTTAGLALLDDATAGDQLTTLGVSAYMKTVLDDTDEATFKATVNLEPGVDVQAYDADIATVAASQAEMETGTETALRSMSPLRVAQAIATLGTGGQMTALELPAFIDGDISIFGMLVIADNGRSRAWGDSYYGSIGTNDNTTGHESVRTRQPVFSPAIPTGVTVTKIVQNNASALALLSNGWVYSTGTNGQGHLGHGDTTMRAIFTRIEYFVTNTITVSDIAMSGGRYSLDLVSSYFLTSTGALYACGYNAYGQLGVGDALSKSTPTACTGVSNVAQLIVSGTHATSVFAITTSNALYACGYNANGQLGVGDNLSKNTFISTGITNAAQVVAVAGFSDTTGWTQGAFTLLRKTDGTVWSCGYGSFYQLGLGSTTSYNTFQQISGLTSCTNIGGRAGYYGYAWAVNAGVLYTWGQNTQGAIGDNSTTARQTPYQVTTWSGSGSPPFDNKIAKVIGAPTWTAGNQGIIVLDTDGILYLSGYDYYYACSATQTTKLKFTPVLIPPFDDDTEKIVDVITMGYDTYWTMFVLTSKGSVFALGYNAYGMANSGNEGVPNYIRSFEKINLN